MAARVGDLEKVKKLLGADVNIKHSPTGVKI